MSDKPKFPAATAMAVADSLVHFLRPFSDRIIVAGSLRRLKAYVGDVEILYIPKFEERKHPEDMFIMRFENLVDEQIAELEKTGVLERRKNVNGSEMFGPKNKLMRHIATGIPVDLFATTADAWFNYLTCRTGPADSNTRICVAAQRKGWKWNPYGNGFTNNRTGETKVMESEEAVFKFVGLPYLPPEKRR